MKRNTLNLARKTIYYRENNKKVKKTLFLPKEWGEAEIEKVKQIIKNLDNKFLQELTDRRILTYCVMEYVNKTKTSHYELMVRKLRKLGI